MPGHPIEHLRYVARATGGDPSDLVQDAAGALAAVVQVEPAGLVPACRRLVERHLTVGPVWWLAARALTAADPAAGALAAGSEMEHDSTGRALGRALPDDATVVVVGWPDIAGAVLRRRGDAEVLVVDASGEGSMLARRLDQSGTAVAVVPDGGVAAAVVVCDLVLIEATAAGPSGVLATNGSHSAAAVAASREIPVWAVTGVGRVLPPALWDALLARLDQQSVEPWDRSVELVPASLLTAVCGPSGLLAPEEGLAQATCPVAPELLRAARG